MDKFVFSPQIDLPLIAVSLGLFLLHSQLWAHREQANCDVDLLARLPSARFRIISVFACILFVCWLANLAVWTLFALLLAIGIAGAVVLNASSGGGEIMLLFAAAAIREWAFGFPQLILQPPNNQHNGAATPDESLLGKSGITVSPIRPMGDVRIDEIIVSASSSDGSLIDAGTEVTVTEYRNGRPCVEPRT